MPPQLRRRWFQFRLRTLLIALTVACLWLGMKAKEARDQRQAVAAISTAGGQVHYSYEYDAAGNLKSGARPAAPRWLMKFFGEDLFVTVVEVGFFTTNDPVRGLRAINMDVTDEALRSLTLLPHLRSLGLVAERPTDAGFETIGSLATLESLNIYSEIATDAGVAHFGRLHRLKRLSLSGVRFSDKSIAALASLPKLQSLELRGGQMTDAGLAYLQQLPALRHLNIYGNTGMGVMGTQITAAGLPTIAKLKSLDTLWLGNVKLTDADLDAFKQMQRLRSLQLFMTGVTTEGLEKLQSSLPKSGLFASTGTGMVYATKTTPLVQPPGATAPANTSGKQSTAAPK